MRNSDRNRVSKKWHADVLACFVKGTQNLYHFWSLTGFYAYLDFVVASG
jgi:hypothetical protein